MKLFAVLCFASCALVSEVSKTDAQHLPALYEVSLRKLFPGK
jgi:hypothetical protein